MAITNLITNGIADGYNGVDWIALTEHEKTKHIFNATVYMMINFSCVVDGEDVDWSDNSTLNEDLQRSCSYYADADRIGILNTAMAQPDNGSHGDIIEYTEKLDTMLRTTKWASTYSTTGNPLESIDNIMSVYCDSIKSKLRRV